ncbi:major facilitator superfamily domain-containing protein 6-like [Mya arenaria]|uniref:major facilitator superfamily domain-containing protein 6-like n=1 Tax=Mya arenaria TaxID=6604 RepID=UPI0022E3BA13|nr:major facilitator superfamily domain-containing protein 6-like [Mya arenaria]
MALPCGEVNRQLFPVKLMYFFFFAGQGAILPFIPVYMRQLGLSATETGIIYGVMPFVAFFVRPLIGVLSDKIQNHKAVLIVCVLLTGVLYNLLLLTPTKQTHDNSAHAITVHMQCSHDDSFIRDCMVAHGGCEIGFKQALDANNFTEISKTCVFQCSVERDSIKAGSTCFTADVGTLSGVTCGSVVNIAISPVKNLIAAIAYDILGEKRGSWGRQRLWGTVGYIIFAVASTFVMDAISQNTNNVDYSVSFYIFLALLISSCVVGYFLKLSENIHCGQLFKNILGLLKYPKVVVFLIAMACYGIMNGVIEAFLFWYLIMLGASQKILGLCLVFQCVPEIIMLQFAGKIIKRIGHMSCLHIACFGYAIRFFCYSIIPGPWYVLPVELLHCLTFALMYAAASSFASEISPEGMSATAQGLVGGLYFGFGKGIGSLVTGQLFDAGTGLGPVLTFRIYGGFAITVLLVYVHLAFFRVATSVKETASYRQAGKEKSAKGAAEKLLCAGDGAAVEMHDRTKPC